LEQIPASYFEEQPNIPEFPEQNAEAVLERIPAETAPLAALNEEPVRQVHSPLDELEEAASFQRISPLAAAVDLIGPEPVDAPVLEILPAELEVKPPTEPLALPVEEVKLPQTYEEWLDYANSSISDGNLDLAVDVFSKLIKKGSNIEETVQSLRSAVYRFPSEVSIWQTLGDGYARSNRLQEALDAYTKAEELLR
jgi:tetratricopeptide (TPR) repeat protein